MLTRSLISMPTDATMKSSDLLYANGTVITRIPQDGLGEISVNVHGQNLKLNARASEAIPSGVAVTITAATSSSSVVVTRSDSAS